MGGAARWLALTVLMAGALGAGVAIKIPDTGPGEVAARMEEMDPTIVAADHAGRIFELREDGVTSRTLARRDLTGGPIGSLAMVEDRSTVWFARHDPLVGLPCDSAIFELSPTRGEVERLADGFGVAASPDGRHLAYVATAEAADGSCRYSAAVLERHTGDVQRWPLDDEWAEAYGICSVAWTGDGARLVVELCVEDDAVLHVVDVGAPTTIGDTTFLGPSDPQRSWTVPATGRGFDDVIAVEYARDQGLVPAGASIVEFGARFGDPKEMLGALDPETSIMGMDADQDGRLVYVEIITGADGAPSWRLSLWEGGDAVPLHDGVVAARW